MSTTKHTPGPWTSQGLAIVASDRSFVCRVYPWCADPQDAECAKANARLIAAAPELLEALEETLTAGINWYETATKSDASELGFVVRARAAIAKAKGES